MWRGPSWGYKWDFSKIRVPYFGDRTIRILLFRVLHYGLLFRKPPNGDLQFSLSYLRWGAEPSVLHLETGNPLLVVVETSKPEARSPKPKSFQSNPRPSTLHPKGLEASVRVESPTTSEALPLISIGSSPPPPKKKKRPKPQTRLYNCRKALVLL